MSKTNSNVVASDESWKCNVKKELEHSKIFDHHYDFLKSNVRLETEENLSKTEREGSGQLFIPETTTQEAYKGATLPQFHVGKFGRKKATFE